MPPGKYLEINKRTGTFIPYLRGDAARDLDICCTLFSGVWFRLWSEFLMYTEPYETSIRLVGVKKV